MKSIGRWRTAIVLTIVCLIIALSGISASACSPPAANGTIVGKVMHLNTITPAICSSYDVAVVSTAAEVDQFGNTTHLPEIVVPFEFRRDFAEAVNTGKIVRITYDRWKVTPCSAPLWATSISYIDKAG